jgi:hypothetical protein
MKQESIEQIKRWCQFIVDTYNERLQDFLEKAAQSPSYAIQWGGAQVVYDEEQAKFARKLIDAIEKRIAEDKTDDMGDWLLEVVSRKRRELLSCFRMPSSTSMFSNAVECFQIEARFQLASDMGGIYERIEEIVKAEKQA